MLHSALGNLCVALIGKLLWCLGLPFSPASSQELWGAPHTKRSQEYFLRRFFDNSTDTFSSHSEARLYRAHSSRQTCWCACQPLVIAWRRHNASRVYALSISATRCKNMYYRQVWPAVAHGCFWWALGALDGFLYLWLLLALSSL